MSPLKRKMTEILKKDENENIPTDQDLGDDSTNYEKSLVAKIEHYRKKLVKKEYVLYVKDIFITNIITFNNNIY